MPQDPTGSGSSSSSSSSDLAESDDRNDDDDDDEESRAFDRLARHDEDPYESVAGEQRPLGCLAAARDQQQPAYETRSVSKVSDYCRRYPPDDHHHRFPPREYIETALTEPAGNCLQDYSSSSANSLDDLCRGHRRPLGDSAPGDDASSTRDHYMVPTRDPRELNERILSLFNPQFLPNFNDMIMYVANQYDTRRSPPPRSRSMADSDGRLFRSSSYRKKRVGASSMFFRRGLTYEAARE